MKRFLVVLAMLFILIGLTNCCKGRFCMKVHDLTEKTTVVQTDEVYLVQSPYGSGDDRRASVANLGNAVGRYQDRGDPATEDWDESVLVKDNAWHDLDCSPIVPAGAKMITFRVLLLGVGEDQGCYFRKKGKAHSYDFGIITQASNQTMVAIARVPCSTERFIQYFFHDSVPPALLWTTIQITVLGWEF